MPPRESTRNKEKRERGEEAADVTEEEEEEEEEERAPKKARKSGGGGGASAAKSAKKGGKDEEADDTLRGLDAFTMFHPSKTAEQFSDFAARAAFSDTEGSKKIPKRARQFTFSISSASREKWAELKRKDNAYQAAKDIARAIVLDAHAGGCGVEAAKINAMLKLRDVDVKFNTNIMFLVDVLCNSVFGYEVVGEAEPKQDGDGGNFILSLRRRYHARLLPVPEKYTGGTAAPMVPSRATQRHQVQLCEAGDRVGARRGLLMAVLGILACCEGQSLAEEELFAALALDPRLAAAAGGAAGAERAFEAFDEQGAGAAGLLARWQDVVRSDFVGARWLVRERRGAGGEDGEGGGAGGVERVYYAPGPAARAHVGALGAVELVRTLHGEPASQVSRHGLEQLRQHRREEVGEFAERGFLKDRGFGVGDFAGGGGEEEEEEEEEEEGEGEGEAAEED